MEREAMKTEEQWIDCRTQLPPENALVETKIHDDRGCRNEQQLRLHNNLWWHADMGMYVYYTPTHWRNVK